MMDVSMYDAQADSINVNDIATNSNNRCVLRRLQQRNEASESKPLLYLYIQNHDGNISDYCPEGAYDMGWLGYFVGKNKHLQELNIRPFEPTSGASVRDVMEPFLRGVSRNKSIRQIDFTNADLLGGEVFTMLTPFFVNNPNLTTINIHHCGLGDNGARLFALAIGSSTNKSLQKVELENNNITDEGMVDIITALSMHPHMKRLDLDENSLGKNGCMALATLLQSSAKELQYLFISRNDIGDEGIEALVPALKNCRHFRFLRADDNPSITTRGWQSFASVLEAPNSNLEEVYIVSNNIDDEAVAAFASALKDNHTLDTLYLDNNPSITAVGWQSFSKTLCNTSSVNATFLSNHTLWSVTRGEDEDANAIIGPLLGLNRRNDKKKVATIKILQNHNDFDMLPFFEWEFKCLPLVINWLEKASAYEMPRGFEPNIEPRKLSTIYQFVRGMPVLYVETRLRKELEDIKAKEKQMEEDQQEFMLRKQMLQRRKESIMKKLGGNVLTNK